MMDLNLILEKMMIIWDRTVEVVAILQSSRIILLIQINFLD